MIFPEPAPAGPRPVAARSEAADAPRKGGRAGARRDFDAVLGDALPAPDPAAASDVAPAAAAGQLLAPPVIDPAGAPAAAPTPPSGAPEAAPAPAPPVGPVAVAGRPMVVPGNPAAAEAGPAQEAAPEAASDAVSAEVVAETTGRPRSAPLPPRASANLAPPTMPASPPATADRPVAVGEAPARTGMAAAATPSASAAVETPASERLAETTLREAAAPTWQLAAEPAPAHRHAEPTASAAVAPAGAEPRAVVAQVAVAMGKSSEGNVEIRLDPPELGRVQILLQPADGGVQAVVLAQRPETQDLLRRHAELLAQELGAAGFGSVSLDFGGGAPSADRDDRPPAAWHAAAFAPVAVEVQPARASRSLAGGLDIRL
jgi:flagellar hook-length control protein FliK